MKEGTRHDERRPHHTPPALSKALAQHSCRSAAFAISLFLTPFLWLGSAQAPVLAGSYTLTSQTGGTASATPVGPPPSDYGGVQNDGYGESGYGAIIHDGSQQSTSATCNGGITTVYTWQPSYPGDAPPQQVLVTETCTARCGGQNYGNTGPSEPVCDDGIKDPPVVSGSTIYDYSQSPPEAVGTEVDAVSTGTHSKVMGGGQTVTVTCSPNASLSINDGPVHACVVYSVSISPVLVTISSTIKTSFFKTEDGNSDYPIQGAHLRNADGSMSGDSAVFWNNVMQVWEGDAGFTANPLGIPNPVYSWTPGGSPLVDSLTDQPTATFRYGFGSSASQSLGQTTTTSCNVTGDSGAAASNNYTITWHYPNENWQLYGRDAPFWQPASLDHCVGDQDSTMAYAYHNTSVTSVFKYADDTGGVGEALTDLFDVATHVVKEPFAPLVAALGLAYEQTVPQDADTGVAFNDVWEVPESTGLPSGRDPSLMDFYRMRPTLLVQYEPQFWHGDAYGANGYIGIASESFSKFTGGVKGAGDFTPTDAPPPGG